MTIQYCSDLHLGFPQNRQWLKDNPLQPVGDVLLLAGDVMPIGPGYERYPFFKWLSDHFEQTFIVPGNHEYYAGHDVSSAPLCTDFHPNVSLVNNIVIELPEVDLICSTLWSKVTQHPIDVMMGMADFRRIRQDGKLIGITQYNQLFADSWAFLEDHIYQQSPKKRIVITHHLPSEQCNVPEFAHSTLNEGFCTDLTSALERATVDYWIYGHSHRDPGPFTIGEVQLLTNQLGYVQYRENHNFDPAKTLIISD